MYEYTPVPPLASGPSRPASHQTRPPGPPPPPPQHHHAVYEYTPVPPLAWPELSGEIWCHRYYLRNLCDEERFRGWEVVEHVPLLQARGHRVP